MRRPGGSLQDCFVLREHRLCRNLPGQSQRRRLHSRSYIRTDSGTNLSALDAGQWYRGQKPCLYMRSGCRDGSTSVQRHRCICLHCKPRVPVAPRQRHVRWHLPGSSRRQLPRKKRVCLGYGKRMLCESLTFYVDLCSHMYMYGLKCGKNVFI